MRIVAAQSPVQFNLLISFRGKQRGLARANAERTILEWIPFWPSLYALKRGTVMLRFFMKKGCPRVVLTQAALATEGCRSRRRLGHRASNAIRPATHHHDTAAAKWSDSTCPKSESPRARSTKNLRHLALVTQPWRYPTRHHLTHVPQLNPHDLTDTSVVPYDKHGLGFALKSRRHFIHMCQKMQAHSPLTPAGDWSLKFPPVLAENPLMQSEETCIAQQPPRLLLDLLAGFASPPR